MNIYPPIEQRFSPFEFYSLMRKNNPVAFDEGNGQWGLYRYNDIEKILKDPIKFSSKFGPFQVPQEFQENLNRPSLLNTDPPYHRKLRSIVDTLFVPIEISKLEPHIENIANDLIDNIIEKGNTTMDLVTDFAYPLPATVIAELLGVPSEDRDTFRQWADNIVSLEITSNIDIDSIRKADKTVSDMDIYFSKLIEKKKKIPTNDLISHIISAKVEGHSLTEKEIFSFCSLLLNAGHVTTVNLIGNLVFSLLENPQEFKRLQENQDSLIKAAIEETLRYRSPVQFLFRIANADVTLFEGREEKGVQKQKIYKGQGITLFLGSANHDESIFTDPERFDITRKNLRHLGFGTGIHFCLGAALARLEGQIALRIILKRFKSLEFNFDNSDRQDLYKKVSPLKSSFLLGLSHLPLRFQPLNS
ncbi:MAG TPA: cytochrome P450 [Nitrososphaeraceae archaeon]|jgi:cytochrome P450|nr:cytochrome P450 [Nitrososphaeraceae archaeon]